MDLKELITSYVTECIEDKSCGFTTDFGIGKMVSTHVYFNLSIIVVSIKGCAGVDFNNKDANSIIDYIYNKIK